MHFQFYLPTFLCLIFNISFVKQCDGWSWLLTWSAWDMPRTLVQHTSWWIWIGQDGVTLETKSGLWLLPLSSFPAFYFQHSRKWAAWLHHLPLPWCSASSQTHSNRTSRACVKPTVSQIRHFLCQLCMLSILFQQQKNWPI